MDSGESMYTDVCKLCGGWSDDCGRGNTPVDNIDRVDRQCDDDIEDKLHHCDVQITETVRRWTDIAASESYSCTLHNRNIGYDYLL